MSACFVNVIRYLHGESAYVENGNGQFMIRTVCSNQDNRKQPSFFITMTTREYQNISTKSHCTCLETISICRSAIESKLNLLYLDEHAKKKKVDSEQLYVLLLKSSPSIHTLSNGVFNFALRGITQGHAVPYFIWAHPTTIIYATIEHENNLRCESQTHS